MHNLYMYNLYKTSMYNVHNVNIQVALYNKLMLYVILMHNHVLIYSSSLNIKIINVSL